MGNAITNTVTGAVESVSKDGVLYNAITGRKERFISGCGSSGGGDGGMEITVLNGGNVVLVHNTVAKKTVVDGDVISVDVAGMTADRSVTMELWLTMPETVVSFSIPDVTWIEEPSFDTANMLYCVVLRWDGARVLANVAYSVEVG